MKYILLLLVLWTNLFTAAKAQNYYYIHGNIPEEIKEEIKLQVQVLAEYLDIQNATIAFMKCKLPYRTNATIEFEDNLFNQRKMFLIRLNENLPESDWQKIIAHEMVHARQYDQKDLIRHTRLSFEWKGENYTNIIRVKHHKRPWEVEAINQEKILLAYFVKCKNQKGYYEDVVASK